jgi:hypothetical protein
MKAFVLAACILLVLQSAASPLRGHSTDSPMREDADISRPWANCSWGPHNLWRLNPRVFLGNSRIPLDGPC